VDTSLNNQIHHASVNVLIHMPVCQHVRPCAKFKVQIQELSRTTLTFSDFSGHDKLKKSCTFKDQWASWSFINI